MSITKVIDNLDLLVLDLETRAGDPDAVTRSFLGAWSPDARWSDETIGRRWREAEAKRREKAALLDSAEIISIAWCWGPGEYEVWHALPVSTSGIRARRTGSEARLLAIAAELLESMDSACILAGHNILGFDMPRLRCRMLRHGIRLPEALARRDQPVFDTMKEWSSRFSVEQRPFIALTDILDWCGLPNHKPLVDGGDVADWLDQERYEDVLAYAAADVVAEYHLVARMLGLRIEPRRKAEESDDIWSLLTH